MGAGTIEQIRGRLKRKMGKIYDIVPYWSDKLGKWTVRAVAVKEGK